MDNNKNNLLDLLENPIPLEFVKNHNFIGNKFEVFPLWDYEEWGSNINLYDDYNGGGHLTGINNGDVIGKLIQYKNGEIKIKIYVITTVLYPSDVVLDLFEINVAPIGYLKMGREIAQQFMYLAANVAKYI